MPEITLVKIGASLTEDQAQFMNNLMFGGYIDGFREKDKAEFKKFWKRIKGMESGELIRFSFSLMRNYRFHKKFFAMLGVGFDAFEPDRKHKTYKGRPIAKNEDLFREEVLILAGYFEQSFNLKGEMKLKAKSISFANMDDAEFEDVYSAVATVLLENVLTNYAGRAELDSVVDRLINFL